jgi:signal transduction histidine kinase
MDFSGSRLLRLAGFVTWALVGVPLLAELTREPSLVWQLRYQLWLACLLVFGIAFAATAWRGDGALHKRDQIGSLVVQTLAALTMIRLVCSGQEGGLLVIVAAQLGGLLTLRPALLWIAVQAALMSAVLAWSWTVHVTLSLSATYMGFQVLAFVSCFLTAREASARTDLARVNRELRATRELVANASRLSERERISRDLHDTLGHHLTALSLNLEMANHLARADDLRDPLQRAQSVTRLLLSEVRDVVGALRGEDATGFREALGTLVEGVFRPTIHLSIEDRLAIADPLRAHTVLRCVQEIVTNAIRHAQATNLWIEVLHVDGDLVIRARDDGRGTAQIQVGHGLAGMQERVALVGGRLDLDSERSGGFRVTARIPPTTSVA